MDLDAIVQSLDKGTRLLGATHKCRVSSGAGEGKMAAAKFGVGDTVRFIGTDRLFTVSRYRSSTHEYLLQRRDDLASSQWVLQIYLELVTPL
jgi:hypothetical protein